MHFIETIKLSITNTTTKKQSVSIVQTQEKNKQSNVLALKQREQKVIYNYSLEFRRSDNFILFRHLNPHNASVCLCRFKVKINKYIYIYIND